MKGVPLAVVKEWMGHKAINTTMRYVHLAPTTLFNAADALDAWNKGDSTPVTQPLTTVATPDTSPPAAPVAELVDAPALGAGGLRPVGVQVPPGAPTSVLPEVYRDTGVAGGVAGRGNVAATHEAPVV